MPSVTTSGNSNPYCLRDKTGGEYLPGVAETDGGFIITERRPTTGGCILNKMDGQMGEKIRGQIADVLKCSGQPIHITSIEKEICISERRILQALCDRHEFRMNESGWVWLPKTGVPTHDPERATILRYLETHGATAMSKLRATLGLSRNAVHASVRTLEAGGHVKLRGAGRERYVSLVEK